MSKYLLGVVNDKNIYLTNPSWDCGWYWSFGYLGNKDCHYHLDGIDKTKNLYDAITTHFQQLNIQPSKIWTFCELFKTAYTLKKTAEVLGRGGSHYATNPCKDIIKDVEYTARINTIVLPALFKEIKSICDSYHEYEQSTNLLKKMLVQGDTKQVIEFMRSNGLKGEDIEPHITKHESDTILNYILSNK